MRKTFNLEVANNGVIIRDLDYDNEVVVFEKSNSAEELMDNEKICIHLGRLILSNILKEMRDPDHSFAAYGAGFNVDFRAFGRARCETAD